MNTHCEITKEAFDALVPIGTLISEIERRENFEKIIYWRHGCRISVVWNYASSIVPQYYIEDINS